MKSWLPKIFVYRVNDCYVILVIIQNDIDILSYPWPVPILRLLNLKYIIVYTEYFITRGIYAMNEEESILIFQKFQEIS